MLLGRLAGAWGKVNNLAQDGGWLVHHKDYVIKEMHGPHPTRPAHVFEDTTSLQAFVKKEVQAEKVKPGDVDILVGSEQIVARLGSYKPDAAQVSTAMALAPAWRAWMAILGKFVEVDTVYLLAREFSAVFPPVTVRVNNQETKRPGGELMISTLADVQITTEGDFRSVRNSTGMITLQGGNSKTSSSVQLPERWELHLPIYEAQLERVAVVELLLTTRVATSSEGKRLQLAFSCPQLTVVFREARLALVEKLQAEMGAEYTVGLGTLKTATPAALLPVEAA
jgi:hypothetical protein